MTAVAIAGVGYTSFTRKSGRSVLDLAIEACRNAATDAGIALCEIDGVGIGDSQRLRERDRDQARTDDMIISSGYNISRVEIEEVLPSVLKSGSVRGGRNRCGARPDRQGIHRIARAG